MASFRFALRDPKAERETRIRLQVRYGSNKVTVYFGESVHPNHWNQGSQKVKGIKTAPEINGRLENIRTAAKNTHGQYLNTHDQKEPPPGELKKLIEIALNLRSKEPELDFFGYFEKFIKIQTLRCETDGKDPRKTVVKDYDRSLELLQEYSRKYMKLEFGNIDEEFYHKYVKFLKEAKAFKVNTVGKHIKCLKSFLNWSTGKGYNDNLTFRTREFKVLTEESVNFYLTEQELQIMKDLDLRPELERYRDSFLIAAWTGLRHSDFSRLTEENIDYEDKVIRIQTKKTGESVVIPFLPELKNVIEKYQEKDLPSYANQPMNRYLKEIGRTMSQKVQELNMNGELKLKDYSRLTTHVGRRSFASNMYFRGIDIEMIMAITGHRTEKLFRQYIKVSGEDKAAKFLKQAQEHKPVINLKIAQ
ncbi:MAG: tyrosine-type recombinase/integrase [Bacteroidales bacterium]|nr:tyrosine-type recombinase/integrase [Bacteroidales bacterium]